jgi:hypothetical protein
MAAVGLPATRSHDAEWLFFFGRVLYKSIIRGQVSLTGDVQ